MPTPAPWSWLYPSDGSFAAPLVARPIEDGLEEAARRWPDAAAIEFNGEIVSFAELCARAARVARGLQDLGVRPGANVALLLKNTPCHAVCFYAILFAGARVVNLSNSMSVAELRQQLDSAQAGILIGGESLCARLAPQQGTDAAGLRFVICSETERDFHHAGPSAPDERPPGAGITLARLAANSGDFKRHPRGAAADEIAVLQFTGGTTGVPKAAMLTHANFSTVPHALNLWAGDAVANGRVLLVVLPLSHVFGLVLMCLSVANGLRMVLHGSFEADRVLEDINSKDVSIFFGVPMMFSALAQHPRTRRTDWSRLRICGSGGAPLSMETFTRFRDATGLEIQEGYSLTEITDIGTWQLIGRPPVPGTVGIPFPLTTIEIVDLDTGSQVLPVGETGEVCFQGPQLMKGYWNRPEETAQAMRGGRFHTGDVGFLDARGYLTLVDRKKDMLIVAGHKVFSKRVEAAIAGHPAVAEACLVGAPSADAGHIPKAFVTLRPGFANLKLAELKTFLRDRLGRYEMPVALEVLAELPRTNVGKVARNLLIQGLPVAGGGQAMDRAAAGEPPRELAAALAGRICGIFEEVAQPDAVAVTPHARLESFGMDSLTIVAVHDRLLTYFPQLPSSVFYEFATVAELAAHMVESFGDCAAHWLHSEGGSAGADAGPGMDEARIADAPPDGPGRRTEAGDHAIAIIGLSGRYAKARTLDEYWDNLKSGRDCMSEIPPERWSLEDWYVANPAEAIAQGKSYCKRLGYLEGFANFDPLFFGIAPKDALAMDPQERLFVQACWEALEDAAYTREGLKKKYRGSVGVFAGITNMGYDIYGPGLWARGLKLFPYTWFSSLANRVSYLFDLHGPSMPVDTMCSSSLTAIHEACQHIRRGECDLALAGAVNVYVHPAVHAVLCMRRMLSSDGRSRAFGAGANGYAPGEGAGVAVLKRLSEAVADGDHIHAVIRGSSINHGGRTNGYTVPSPAAQSALIRDALKDAGVNAREISYLEAHGTGTELGDPIEINGLHRAFSADTQDAGFCAIGSVKSNIGHCESAAGMAGLTKVVLQMKHAKLVPSLHVDAVNPRIDFAPTAFRLQKDFCDWKRPVVTLDGVAHEAPRIAGISSFGAGGSNAHIIIEEYVSPQVAQASAEARPELIVLSAATPAALAARASALAMALAPPLPAEVTLDNIAWTLQVGREAMRCRLALVAASIAELRERLACFARDAKGPHGARMGEVSSASARPDEDVRRLDAWIGEGDLLNLAKAWIEGRDIDWERMGAGRRRLSLPVYRFEGERYWAADLLVDKDKPTPGKPIEAQAAAADAGAEAIFFSPRRRDLGWPTPAQPAAALPREHWILFASLCNGHALQRADSLESAIARAFPAARCVDLAAACDGDTVIFEQLAERLLTLIQEALSAKTPLLLQVVARAAGAGRCLAGLSGMLATAALESPDLTAQLVLLVAESPASAQAIETLGALGARSSGTLRLDEAPGIEPLEECALTAAATTPWRDGGIYLVSGGAGAIGFLFAEEIARRTQGAAVVLIGRGELSAEKSRRLAALRARGLRIHHLRLDIGDAAAVARAVAETVERFGRIDGVLHAAGVIRDELLSRKSADALREVLRPKVGGLRNLDEATRELRLDFFVCFSSTAALGNVGQADYATANAFLDAYVGYRNDLVRSGQRRGASISINWPLWQDGGMTVSDSARARMKKEWGVVPLPAAVAMEVLARVIGSGKERVAVTYGEADKLRRAIAAVGSVASSRGGEAPRDTAAAPSTGAPDPALVKATEDLLKQVFTTTAGIELSRLDAEASFNDYGVDSILIMDMTEELERTLGPLSKTLFFEFPSISKLAGALAASHGAKLASVLGIEPPGAPPLDTGVRLAAPKAAEVEPAPTDSGRRFNGIVPHVAASIEEEPIAVIGVQGFYPGAADMDAHWRNLETCTDCIVEIDPAWATEQMFHPDPATALASGRNYCKWGGRLNPSWAAGFDPAMIPRTLSLSSIDPVERMFLGAVHDLLRDARYDTCDDDAREARPIGLFVCGNGSPATSEASEAASVPVELSGGIRANRISFMFDLRGPSMAVDTMSSSSLAAVHYACSSLRRRECRSAIAGGFSILSPDYYRLASRLRFLGSRPDSRSFTAGDGYLPGECAGAVLLKPLRFAEQDGDKVLALIRATVSNHTGKFIAPFTPSPRAQSRLVEMALQAARVEPCSISYVEAAANGSVIGDAVEFSALSGIFRHGSNEPGFCALGSIKANIGHAAAASGISQLTKVILQLKHGVLVPTRLAGPLNPEIRLKDSPFRLPDEAAEWRRPVVNLDGVRTAVSRRALVNSFGAGGSYVSAVLEEYGRVE
jgi:acyl transferase domain-containing protein/acyl-CoA synthetase (AMP-forming)/AMP-acid ligase II